MGKMIDTWTDEETPALAIEYERQLSERNPGRTDSLGVPLEPDDDTYIFRIRSVFLYDVEIDLSWIQAEGLYDNLDDLTIDVQEQVYELVDKHFSKEI